MTSETKTTQLHVWKLDDGECWWVVAATEEDARRFGAAMDIGCDDDGEFDCEMVPDDQVLTVASPDDDPVPGEDPEGATITPRDGHRPPKITATCEAWARSSKPGALIACTVF